MKIKISQPTPDSLQHNHHKSLLILYKSLPIRHKSLPNQNKSLLNPSSAHFILLLVPIFILFFSSCEKVIDVDLNESEPAIVIEGSLSHNDGVLKVKVSKTASYFSKESNTKVGNADVILDNGPGFRFEAEETEPGMYSLNNLQLNTNSVYRLTVRVENEEFVAVSALPPMVDIDSIGYEYQQEQAFFDGGYRLHLYFKDPIEKENFYRIKVYRNGKRFDEGDDLIVFDDTSLDGKTIQVRLRGQLFNEGDSARVELYSIDKNAWKYLTTLRELANLNPGSPAPANPLSNFSNDALGYFSAWTKSTRQIIIQESSK